MNTSDMFAFVPGILQQAAVFTAAVPVLRAHSSSARNDSERGEALVARLRKKWRQRWKVWLVLSPLVIAAILRAPLFALYLAAATAAGFSLAHMTERRKGAAGAAVVAAFSMLAYTASSVLVQWGLAHSGASFVTSEDLEAASCAMLLPMFLAAAVLRLLSRGEPAEVSPAGDESGHIWLPCMAAASLAHSSVLLALTGALMLIPWYAERWSAQGRTPVWATAGLWAAAMAWAWNGNWEHGAAAAAGAATALLAGAFSRTRAAEPMSWAVPVVTAALLLQLPDGYAPAFHLIFCVTYLMVGGILEESPERTRAVMRSGVLLLSLPFCLVFLAQWESSLVTSSAAATMAGVGAGLLAAMLLFMPSLTPPSKAEGRSVGGRRSGSNATCGEVPVTALLAAILLCGIGAWCFSGLVPLAMISAVTASALFQLHPAVAAAVPVEYVIMLLPACTFLFSRLL